MIVWPDATDPLGDAGIEALAAEIRDRLGPAPEPPQGNPLVSIVVLNCDGVDHLRRLLGGLIEQTDYPNFELILVDNDSSDESLDFIRSVEAPFPISILANHHNESFSDANNQGAELASGELLLFLNNDVAPFEPGWLRELVGCLRAERAGIAGATLIFPKEGSPRGYLVQHRAMLLMDAPALPPADLHGHGEDPLGEGFGEDADTAIPTGACMLIERDLFRRIGGFTHGYVYGGEDIDLALKVREQGHRVICSGRSTLIHRFSTTRRKEKGGKRRAKRLGNQQLLWECWGPRLRREYELDRLDGGGSWAAPGQGSRGDAATREEVLALGFCLKSEPAAPARSGDPLDALRAELERRGHRCTVLREDAIDGPMGFNYDVAIHMRGPIRYIPRPAQLNVLWAVSHFDALTPIECNRYDLILTGDAGLAKRLREGGSSVPIMPIGEEDPAGSLLKAVLARARQLDFPTRISPHHTAQPV